MGITDGFENLSVSPPQVSKLRVPTSMIVASAVALLILSVLAADFYLAGSVSVPKLNSAPGVTAGAQAH